jgi:signal transduction histidine kinase
MDNLPRSGKLGLMGMQERVRLLGGNFDMVSTPGQGTMLTFDIPFP